MPTRYYPINLTHPRVSTLAGNSYWSVTALTAHDEGSWKLSASAESRVYGHIRVPAEVAATPNAGILLAVTANATTGAHRLHVKTISIAEGESINPASLTAETAQNITVPGTARLLDYVTFPAAGNLGTTVAADDMLYLEIVREGGDVTNDTLAVVTELHDAFLRIDV